MLGPGLGSSLMLVLLSQLSFPGPGPANLLYQHLHLTVDFVGGVFPHTKLEDSQLLVGNLLTLFLLATESLLAKDPSRFFFLGGRFGVSELGVRLRPDSSPLEDPCRKEIIMPRIGNIETTCAGTKMLNFVMQ